jgi:hypothetical protein
LEAAGIATDVVSVVPSIEPILDWRLSRSFEVPKDVFEDQTLSFARKLLSEKRK